MKSNFKFINVQIWILMLVFFSACEQHKNTNGDQEHIKMDSVNRHNAKKPLYYCPMHPEITSDKPGICPICKMDLELTSYEEEADTMASLLLPTNNTVLSTLKAITPSSNNLSRKIEAKGYLTYNPDFTSSISARVSGRVEKLYVRYNFQQVRKGEKLLELYSPELLTAQNEYLYLLKTNDRSDSISKQATKLKLTNLGMTKETLSQLERTETAHPYVPIYATSSGHVHFLSGNIDMSAHALSWPGKTTTSAMNANTESMNSASEVLREGDYVKKGDALFVIADDSGIWVLFKILPSDIPYIQKGDAVEIDINKITHEGKVNFIEKSFDANSDFYTVRVYMNCNDHTNLRIGTLVTGSISVQQKDKKTLWVPKQAVLSLGKNKSIVFVKKGQGYQAREIRSGEFMNEWIEVTNGLSATDSIAPVASYLVDSEAFILTEE